VALAKLHATRSPVARPGRRLGGLVLVACFGLAAAGLLAYLLSTR
jgi:hypothetical protein